MPQLAEVTFKTRSLTQQVSQPLGGISFVLGRTLMGPIDDPSKIINSWKQFVKYFGGEDGSIQFPTLCKKMLEAGAKLRVCRVTNHDSAGSKSTLSAGIKVVFDANLITDNSVNITINGDDLGDVAFDTDHDPTMNAIITALKLLDVVEDAILDPSDTDNRTILIFGQDLDNSTSSFTVTGGVSQADDTVTAGTAKILSEDGDSLFTLSAKNQGAEYNNLVIEISDASNGDSDYFNLTITSSSNNLISEVYENLKVVAGLDTASTYLQEIETLSNLVEVSYEDTSSATNLIPLRVSNTFENGTDGIAPLLADYVGTSANNYGFHSFDDYDDSLQILVPELSETFSGLHEAGAAYAAARKDLMYFGHLDNSNSDKDAYITARGTDINTKFAALFGGGVKLYDIENTLSNFSELADVVIAATRTDENNSPYTSFAGPRKGLIDGIMGIVNNYGTPGKLDDFKELAQKQINMVINRDGRNMLWGNFTTQITDDQNKFLHIVRGLINFTKILKPTIEEFIEEPNTPQTWNNLYLTVKPFLDSLLNEFFYTYEWQGDQNAAGVTDDDLQVNTATDVANGKYKVRLILTLIPTMQQIEIEIIQTVAGIEFNF